MISSLRCSSRAVSLWDLFKSSSQRKLCILLTTIFRPSVSGEPSLPFNHRGTYSSTLRLRLRLSAHSGLRPPFVGTLRPFRARFQQVVSVHRGKLVNLHLLP